MQLSRGTSRTQWAASPSSSSGRRSRRWSGPPRRDASFAPPVPGAEIADDAQVPTYRHHAPYRVGLGHGGKFVEHSPRIHQPALALHFPDARPLRGPGMVLRVGASGEAVEFPSPGGQKNIEKGRCTVLAHRVDGPAEGAPAPPPALVGLGADDPVAPRRAARAPGRVEKRGSCRYMSKRRGRVRGGPPTMCSEISEVRHHA